MDDHPQQYKLPIPEMSQSSAVVTFQGHTHQQAAAQPLHPETELQQQQGPHTCSPGHAPVWPWSTSPFRCGPLAWLDCREHVLQGDLQPLQAGGQGADGWRDGHG